MTIDKSLKVKKGVTRSRNVLTRVERIEKMKEMDKWQEGDSKRKRRPSRPTMPTPKPRSELSGIPHRLKKPSGYPRAAFFGTFRKSFYSPKSSPAHGRPP